MDDELELIGAATIVAFACSAVVIISIIVLSYYCGECMFHYFPGFNLRLKT